MDASTGAVRWRQPLSGWIRQDTVDSIDRQVLVTAAGVVAVEEISNLVVGRAAADGSIRWRTAIDAVPGTPRWTAAGRVLLTRTPIHPAVPAAAPGASPAGGDESLLTIATDSGQVLSRSRLPLLRGRPATPLGNGAVIQVSDPRRACLDAAGTAGG